MDTKMAAAHNEQDVSSETEKSSHLAKDIERTRTEEIDNYHGLTLKTSLVYLAMNLLTFCQLYNVVGAGNLARSIGAALNGATETQWIGQGLVIMTCLLGPPVSQAADYWGRKWFIVILSVFGVVGSIVLARANSMNTAIAAQVINGVSYGAQPLLFAVGSEILPRRVRPAAQAGFQISGGFGGIMGLLLGDALTKTNPFGFRTYWYISTGITAAATIITAICYNPPLRPLQKQLTLSQKLRRLDWVAYFLLAVGIVLFTMGLSWGDNPYPWKDAHVVAPLVVGAVFLLALVVHQTFIKKDGLIDHRLFSRDRNFAICLVGIFIEGVIFWAANNYFSFEASVLFGVGGVKLGLMFAVTFFVAIGASFFIAYFSSKTKLIREPLVASFILFTIFCILMATATVNSYHGFWGYPVLLGIGLGWCLALLVSAAQLSAPPDLIAITSGLIISMRSLGGSVGLGIYTAIFSSTLSDHIGKDIAAAVLPLGFNPRNLEQFIGALASNNQAALGHVPGVTPQIIGAGVGALKHAYLVSFRGVWIAAAAFSFVTAIACCFVINPKKDLHMHVDAPLEEENQTRI